MIFFRLLVVFAIIKMKQNERSAFIKRIAAMFFCLVLAMAVISCADSGSSETDGQAAPAAAESEMTPKTRDDGSKFRIAYVDYDEYIQASRQVFYILKRLEETGWISEGSLPFTIDDINEKNMSTREMYNELVSADLGDYIEFADNAFSYLAYDDPDAAADNLKSRAGKDIDLVLTFGTSAGVFAKELGLPVPLVDFGATDPVASGILESSEAGRSEPLVWANVEPSVPLRQLKYYHSLKPFKKLGLIIYGDETVSGVPDIMRSSEEIGFDVVKYNIEEQPRETEEELAAYYDLVESKVKEMADEDIDAFFFTIDLVNEADKLPRFLEPFYAKNIPVYMMDDAETVKNGGLMLIMANDLENAGSFTADSIGKILCGEEPGSLPCIYTSSPSIYVNYKTAKRIGYPLTFEFLTVCDEIYGGDN